MLKIDVKNQGLPFWGGKFVFVEKLADMKGHSLSIINLIKFTKVEVDKRERERERELFINLLKLLILSKRNYIGSFPLQIF